MVKKVHEITRQEAAEWMCREMISAFGWQSDRDELVKLCRMVNALLEEERYRVHEEDVPPEKVRTKRYSIESVV